MALGSIRHSSESHPRSHVTGTSELLFWVDSVPPPPHQGQEWHAKPSERRFYLKTAPSLDPREGSYLLFLSSVVTTRVEARIHITVDM